MTSPFDAGPARRLDADAYVDPVRVVAWLHDGGTIECEFPSGRVLAALFFGRIAAERVAAFALEAMTHDGNPVMLTFSRDDRRTCTVDFAPTSCRTRAGRR